MGFATGIPIMKQQCVESEKLVLMKESEKSGIRETVNATVLRPDPQPPSPKFHTTASYLSHTAINFSLVKAK